MIKPLEGFTILDFSQFLAGPFTALRLADLGAKVIKVEKPGTGDSYRTNYGPAIKLNGDNAAYYYVNRNKESISVDLKDEAQREKLLPLLRQADVMLINFRPDVTKRLGLDYESVKAVNPAIVYAQITGYGEDNAWKDRPGQDLLVQCATGACYLNGSGPAPIPFGVSVADEFSGMYLVQGILAGLYQADDRRGLQGGDQPGRVHAGHRIRELRRFPQRRPGADAAQQGQRREPLPRRPIWDLRDPGRILGPGHDLGPGTGKAAGV